MVAPVGAALYSRVAVVEQSGKVPINGGGALKPERFGCLKIDNEIEFGRLYNWEDVT